MVDNDYHYYINDDNRYQFISQSFSVHVLHLYVIFLFEACTAAPLPAYEPAEALARRIDACIATPILCALERLDGSSIGRIPMAYKGSFHCPATLSDCRPAPLSSLNNNGAC